MYEITIAEAIRRVKDAVEIEVCLDRDNETRWRRVQIKTLSDPQWQDTDSNEASVIQRGHPLWETRCKSVQNQMRQAASVKIDRFGNMRLWPLIVKMPQE